MKSFLQSAVCGISTLWASASWAHEGHGLSGSHWHATDVFGLALALAVGALMWWWSQDK